MDVREKLGELCEDVVLSCKSSLCVDCEHNGIDYPNCMGVHFADHLIANGVTVGEAICKLADLEERDAVEVDDMRAFAKDVAYQFGYYCQYEGRLHITHGGLSTLEEAFEILGWKNPHPVPECECEIDGCHEHATCGAPTVDGYKRMCSKHYREWRTHNNGC